MLTFWKLDIPAKTHSLGPNAAMKATVVTENKNKTANVEKDS